MEQLTGKYFVIPTRGVSYSSPQDYNLLPGIRHASCRGFEPLVHLPKHKNIILGLITSKFPQLEDLGEMKSKVFAAADLVAKGSGGTREEALRRLGVSPQCGFASHSGGNALGHEDIIAKLKLVRKLADEIWPGEP
jgi:methionine synthase II (cobalamin-independent)